MRFIFKTKYDQDINIAKHNGDKISYGLLILSMVLIPFFIDDFYLGELSYVFILAIAGIGLYKLFGLGVVPAILAGWFVYSKLEKKNKVLSVVVGLISGVVVYLIFITFLYAYFFE